jgi:hypothetical protein
MKTKLITQFACKSRDESFKSSYFMIEQCLLNKNERVSKSKKKTSPLSHGSRLPRLIDSAALPPGEASCRTSDCHSGIMRA